MGRNKQGMSKGRNRRSQARRAYEKRVRERLAQGVAGPQVRIAPGSDGVKMSDVLERFVEPYAEFIDTVEAYRRLLMLAIVAWNVALFPENKRKSELDRFLSGLPVEDRSKTVEVVHELMQRKQADFAQYKRMIFNFEVAATSDGWHLTVLSTPDPV